MNFLAIRTIDHKYMLVHSRCGHSDCLGFHFLKRMDRFEFDRWHECVAGQVLIAEEIDVLQLNIYK